MKQRCLHITTFQFIRLHVHLSNVCTARVSIDAATERIGLDLAQYNCHREEPPGVISV